MNTKIIIAAVAGSVAAFLLGWVVWGMLLMDYYDANTIKYEGLMLPENEMRLWAIYISNLAGTVMMAWLFDKMNVSTLSSGVQAGAIIYFLVALSFDMIFYSMMNWFNGTTIIFVDIIVNAIFGGIIGGIVAMLLGMGNKKAAA
jgi:hypothetical protein